MFTVIEHRAINVLLGKAFKDEHILVILPDKKSVIVRKSTPFATVEQHNVSAAADATKQDTQNANTNTYFEARDDQRSTTKHSNIVRVAGQKLL